MIINGLNWDGMKRETKFLQVPLCYHATAKEYNAMFWSLEETIIMPNKLPTSSPVSPSQHLGNTFCDSGHCKNTELQPERSLSPLRGH